MNESTILTSPNVIRIVIIDDHPAMLIGLSSMLSTQAGMQVVGTLSSGRFIAQLPLDLKPNVFLLDLRMPDMNGIECLQRLGFRFPSAHVLIITSYDMDEDIFRALEAGAVGYLTKNVSQEEMMRAIRRAAAGKHYLPTDIARKLALRNQRSELTAREVQILRELVKGNTNKQIGAWLGISENTVRNHVNSIISKLEVQDRTEAAVTALKRGLVRIEDI